MSDETDAIWYRRPDPQIGRPDLRWLEVRARGTIADLGGWWEQVNPAWIERHLDPGTCRATEPSGIDPALHRVTCCRNHAEVDLRIEEIADLLLLYPFLPEGDRARRYRLVDALYSDLFLAWWDSADRPGDRRLPIANVVEMQQAFFDQSASEGRRRRRPESLAWLDAVAENVLPRHMGWWHDIDRDAFDQEPDAEITDHLDEIGLLLMLTTFADPALRERIRVWTSLDGHLEHLLRAWMGSAGRPRLRRLTRADLTIFRTSFGRVNPYMFFFE